MIPTLLLFGASEVVIMTASSAISDDKVGIIDTFFQWISHRNDQSHNLGWISADQTILGLRLNYYGLIFLAKPKW